MQKSCLAHLGNACRSHLTPGMGKTVDATSPTIGEYIVAISLIYYLKEDYLRVKLSGGFEWYRNVSQLLKRTSFSYNLPLCKGSVAEYCGPRKCGGDLAPHPMSIWTFIGKMARY